MESKLARVPQAAKQARETQWNWAEPSVWTDRMLTALDKGVKGYFKELGLFSMATAWDAFRQSCYR